MDSFLTIEQLIKRLENYPKDLLVLVDGYEGGLDAILDTKLINVDYDKNKKWWYGSFEESSKANIKALKLLSTRDISNSDS